MNGSQSSESFIAVQAPDVTLNDLIASAIQGEAIDAAHGPSRRSREPKPLSNSERQRADRKVRPFAFLARATLDMPVLARRRCDLPALYFA
jgi:hypothetical protein